MRNGPGLDRERRDIKRRTDRVPRDEILWKKTKYPNQRKPK
jgi:hypothetical protein